MSSKRATEWLEVLMSHYRNLQEFRKSLLQLSTEAEMLQHEEWCTGAADDVERLQKETTHMMNALRVQLRSLKLE